jgi:hypothetical protein
LFYGQIGIIPRVLKTKYYNTEKKIILEESIMNEQIKIHNYVFELKKYRHSDSIISCSFAIEGKPTSSLTEDELKLGHIYQQEIFSGKWNWLIFNRGLVRMSEFKVEISLINPIYDGSLRWDGGSITSEMKEVCPHCEDRNCDFDCPEAMEWASDRDSDFTNDKMDELEGNRNFNHGVNAIESMILTHAMAGINVESEMYKSGIRAALDGLANNT